MLRNTKHLRTVLVLIAILLWVGFLTQCAPQRQPSAEQRAAVTKALDWLRTQQLEDGSFSTGFGHPAGATCDAALAIVASGGDAMTWRSAADKPSVAEYLAAHAAEYATDAASTSKLIVTLVAAGLDPKSFAGNDWIARLESLSDGTGTYDKSAVGQSWAILALAAARQPVPANALTVLKGYQLESGAWDSGFGPDNDTTAYALQALIAGGEPKNSPTIQKALAFLQGQQNDDGGFPAIKPSDWGTDTNANSTASVIMALIAVGENPAGTKWSKAGGNPVTALLGLQAADGKIEFQPGVGNPLLATTQAIPALLGKPLPLRGQK